MRVIIEENSRWMPPWKRAWSSVRDLSDIYPGLLPCFRKDLKATVMLLILQGHTVEIEYAWEKGGELPRELKEIQKMGSGKIEIRPEAPF